VAREKERDRNEVGEPLYPVFMAKTAALFFFVFGILAVFGAIAQINPIWLFGRTTPPYPPTRPSPTGTSVSSRERCA
jgi:quinol-cytochrome oxidoreductase complex cytochrome b subunit